MKKLFSYTQENHSYIYIYSLLTVVELQRYIVNIQNIEEKAHITGLSIRLSTSEIIYQARRYYKKVYEFSQKDYIL